MLTLETRTLLSDSLSPPVVGLDKTRDQRQFKEGSVYFDSWFQKRDEFIMAGRHESIAAGVAAEA